MSVFYFVEVQFLIFFYVSFAFDIPSECLCLLWNNEFFFPFLLGVYSLGLYISVILSTHVCVCVVWDKEVTVFHKSVYFHSDEIYSFRKCFLSTCPPPGIGVVLSLDGHIHSRHERHRLCGRRGHSVASEGTRRGFAAEPVCSWSPYLGAGDVSWSWWLLSWGGEDTEELDARRPGGPAFWGTEGRGLRLNAASVCEHLRASVVGIHEERSSETG